jgi:hypothetical protein
MLCATFAKTLSDVIKNRVKELRFSRRYKYVSIVTIGQLPELCLPSVMSAGRCVWSPDTDNFATVTWRKGDIFAVATIYAIYTE